MNPEKGTPNYYIEQGAKILGEILRPRGFKFQLVEPHIAGSGGVSSEGAFTTGIKRLEFHFRHSLGMVTYHVGDHRISHKNYMKCLGVNRKARYPGTSSNPLDAFADLKWDLTQYCADFVLGDGSEVRKFAFALEQDPEKFNGLP